METEMNNVVTLIGRLGEKPSCRTLNDGARLASLSLATDDGYRGSDGNWAKRTAWHRLTVFGEKRVAYIEDHYRKGDLILFTGRISYSQWEKDGFKHYGVELVGSTSLLASASRDGKTTSSDKTSIANDPNHDLDDEVPF